MRYTKPDPQQVIEEDLRRENQRLREQIEKLQGGQHGGVRPRDIWKPSGVTIGAIFLG